jgi:hypothetical protein
MAVKDELHSYLRDAREVLVWKLDGLDEYDVRRPLTPTGTNLLGLVRHAGSSHLRYFGDVFGRPVDPALSWLHGDGGPNSDMWVRPAEARSDVVEACRAAWTFADEVILELPLDAPGVVPWWGPEPVTLHRVLVHITAETQRHAGHADVLRELLDGSAGLLAAFDNLQARSEEERTAYVEQVEAAARLASDR